MNHVIPLTRQLKDRMSKLAEHLQAAAMTVAEPKARDMLENSAALLNDLIKTFDDYEKKNDGAWNKRWDLTHPKPPPQDASFLMHFGQEVSQ